MKTSIMKQLLVALSFLYASLQMVSAETFMYRNLNYEIITYRTYDKNGTVKVAVNENVKGDISIPKTVYKTGGHYGDYNVVAVGNSAFARCSELKGVTIPESVTTIESGAFVGCTGLTSVTIPEGVTEIHGRRYEGNSSYYSSGAFEGCTGLKSVTLPSTLKLIDEKVFKGCSALDAISIPANVERIGSEAFYGCAALTHVTLPESINEIDSHTFDRCSNLESVTLLSGEAKLGIAAFQLCNKLKGLDANITGIEDYAFYGCSSLENVKLSNSVISLGQYSFANCWSLKRLDLPGTIESVGLSAFDGMSDTKIYMMTRRKVKVDKGYGYVDRFGQVEFHMFFVNWQEFAPYCNKDIVTYDNSISIKDNPVYLFGLQYRLYENPNYDPKYGGKATVSAVGFTPVEPDADGWHFVTDGIKIGADYWLKVCIPSSETPEKTDEYMVKLSTRSGSELEYVNVMSEVDQTSVTFLPKLAWQEWDTTAVPSKFGIEFNGEKYEIKDDPIKFDGLEPGKTYEYRQFVYFNNNAMGPYYTKKSFSTKKIIRGVQRVSSGPTSISLEAQRNEGDAEIAEEGFYLESVGGETVSKLITSGGKLDITGLEPSTKYVFSYKVKLTGGSTYNQDYSFETPALKLTTLDPKGVTATSSIVSASTNISERETGAGFQWKKYDAPESLKPSEAFAAIYDGTLEGCIKNLQSTSYYVVRAFYKSGNGNYTYGEWVTFDPSNFSYMEPTAHTREPEGVSEYTVVLKAYVLQGSDDVISQGFEYWKLAGGVRSRAVTSTPGVMTVEGFGQNMQVVLTDLEPGTDYAFRSYVETKSGITYGEEQTFRTKGEPSGIESVEDDMTAPEIVGYFDMTGRRYDEPQQGFNIALYSDGTTRKFIKR